MATGSMTGMTLFAAHSRLKYGWHVGFGSTLIVLIPQARKQMRSGAVVRANVDKEVWSVRRGKQAFISLLNFDVAAEDGQA